MKSHEEALKQLYLCQGHLSYSQTIEMYFKARGFPCCTNNFTVNKTTITVSENGDDMSIDYSNIAARLSDDKRDAISMMGKNEDSCDGFEITTHLMRELLKQGLVVCLDKQAKFPKYKLSSDGLGVLDCIIDRKATK